MVTRKGRKSVTSSISGSSGNANTVKIDENLLKKLKELIEDEEIRIEYPTVKQFVNVAVLRFLREKLREKAKLKEGKEKKK